ncbi:hypothetical protein EU528_12575 [Candidatus Thorarchaeota archaeon]|nr:MAG: hypothetical protein EU528_12575 [Candidatus Thorarchaeota archaeon]
MKQIGEFTLSLSSKREMPIEVLLDHENTIIMIDCQCCEEYLSSRLPGGVLIPIASALKNFFGEKGMRNLDVNVSGTMMRRTYKGLMNQEDIPDMTKSLEQAVKKFTRKKKF